MTNFETMEICKMTSENKEEINEYLLSSSKFEEHYSYIAEQRRKLSRKKELCYAELFTAGVIFGCTIALIAWTIFQAIN